MGVGWGWNRRVMWGGKRETGDGIQRERGKTKGYSRSNVQTYYCRAS